MKSGGTRLRAVVIVVTGLVLCVGFRDGHKTTPRERAVNTPSAPPAVASDLTGIWTVIAHHIPGISAITDTEATAWHGRTVRLTANQAVSGGNHCDGPAYAEHVVAKDQFLGSEFALSPGSLKPVVSLDRLTVLEVSCGGARWTAMGVRLIGISADRALAPWDGVFFELARDRDFQAMGSEPFWRLEITKGKEVRFAQVAKADVVTPAPVAEIDSGKGATVYRAVTEANDLRVVIEPTPCTEVMSGKPFEATVTVTLNGQTYHGCGGPLP